MGNGLQELQDLPNTAKRVVGKKFTVAYITLHDSLRFVPGLLADPCTRGAQENRLIGLAGRVRLPARTAHQLEDRRAVWILQCSHQLGQLGAGATGLNTIARRGVVNYWWRRWSLLANGGVPGARQQVSVASFDDPATHQQPLEYVGTRGAHPPEVADMPQVDGIRVLAEVVVGQLLQPCQFGVDGGAAGEIGVEGGWLGVHRGLRG